MNREFKFRLWSKSEKCFVNPNILEVWDESGNMTPFQFVKTGKLDPIYMPVENYVIQQFTGLKDAKETEICEGDILEWKGEFIAEVFFEQENAAFVIKSKKGGKAFMSENYALNFQIIGNIFENPLLLK